MPKLPLKSTTTFCIFVLLISFGATLPLIATAAKEFQPLLTAKPFTVSNPGIPPFTPQQIWKAYDFQPLFNANYKGSGQVIAIVDAYGSKSITNDVATFSSQFGLPSATINIYYPDGKPRRSNSNWAIETSLDVEWAHAIAPQATIALVVAYDASFQRVYNAINYAINNVPGVTTLSMSFGALETDYSTSGSYNIAAYHSLFVAAANKGISSFASSGDNGATSQNSIIYPASDPLVTAVGGTSLYLTSDGSYSSETTWSGSGSGASIVFSKPSYQTTGDSMRDIADVAYDADPNTGFYVFYSRNWYQVGGTSAGAPQWAAIFALATQYHAHTYGNANDDLYGVSKSVYHDTTTGNNGYFTATTSWDYPTGWGTPDAYKLVTALP